MEDSHTVPFEHVLHTELDAISSRRTEPLPSKKDDENAYRRAERSGLFGLCFSGGGIRSATFNLGVLQALQELKLLDRVDYLSTVSGGGYIGSWFISWVKRLSAFPNLRGDLVEGEFKEPNPIRHLRRFSNYLTPKVGLMNADTWSIASTYARNLILNSFIIIPLIVAALLVPRVLELFPLLLGPLDTRIIIIASYGLLIIAGYCVGLNLVWEKDGSQKSKSTRGLESGGKSPVPQKATKVPPSFYVAVVCTFAASCLGSYLLVDVKAGEEIFSSIETPLDWVGQGFLWYVGLWIFSWVLSLVLPFGKEKEEAASSPDKTPRPQSAARPDLRTMLRGFRGWSSVLLGGLAAAPVCGLLFYFLYEIIPTLQLTSEIILVFGMPAVMAALAFVVILQIGFAGSRLPDYAREWWSRFGGGMSIGLMVWIAGTGAALFSNAIVEAVTGWVSGFQLTLGWLVTTVTGLLGAKSDKTGKGGAGGIIELLVKLTPAVFVVGIVILLSYGIHLQSFPRTATFLTLAIGACVLVSALFAWRVNVNTFSMNSMYYNRLVRCYLGASRQNRTVNPVIGFDEKDDEYRLYDFRGYSGPYPIINTAVNLVKGKELSWQKRKASSFMFTPHFCGYRSGVLDHYGESDKFPVRLGRAVSISGAAASPNMGYHSSAPLAFLMTVFNVRLGSWFPNPGVKKLGREGCVNTERGPGWGLLYLLRELFGLTDDASSFVYLSDGGHFENLGLYELVRRRCQYVIVCDAGADPKTAFGDLGNAIEKCRADFGVEISLETGTLRRNDTGMSGAHFVTGTIRYPGHGKAAAGADGPEGSVGQLLYIKSH